MLCAVQVKKKKNKNNTKSAKTKRHQQFSIKIHIAIGTFIFRLAIFQKPRFAYKSNILINLIMK